jgi:hypothetical protein
MARDGLPQVLLDLLTHRVLTTADGERLVEAARATDLRAQDRELVVRDLQHRLVEVHLAAGDVAAAGQVAARMSAPWSRTGWREIAAFHAANGDAAAFFRDWGRYEAGRDRAQMTRLKARLVASVAAGQGWRAASDVCRDKRVGVGFLRHAFEPPAHGYDDLVSLFDGEAAGLLPEADELHCLVAAAAAESRPRPLADHHGVENLLARVGALDPSESTEAMRTRDHLLSTLYLAVGSEDTLARLRAQLRTPRLRTEAMHLFTGPYLRFADLGLKLAVVRELCARGLLPAWTADGGTADEGAPGGAAEVRARLEALEVHSDLATTITTLRVDLGDAIYRQVAQDQDGPDDVAPIEDFSDIRHFPNLRSVTLPYRGHEVRWEWRTSRPTHVTQSNGQSRGPFVDSVRPYPYQLRSTLRRMNGTSFWAYAMWRAPDGADLLADVPLSDEYLQCAGRADAMTVELRTLDPDGTAHQYVVGRPGGDDTGEPTEVVRWDDGRHGTTVHPHEVFPADEAADAFYAYFLTDEVAGPYVLRELDLTWPSPAPPEGGHA